MTIKTTAAYQAAMQQANIGQRQAIEAIHGPVLVLAGPGTGKTQILSLRIGNILQQTDAAPENILCLTYTDAGATAMRRRLKALIGSAADGVTISTFHGFCSQLIQQGMVSGRDDRPFEPMDDLDRFEILSDMIDELAADHPLKNLRGMKYFYVRHLEDLFDIMSREAIAPSTLIDECDRYLAEMSYLPEYQYKNANKKKGIVAGDPKQHLIDKEIPKYEKTKAGAALFDRYKEMKMARGRFDFNDMIFDVLGHLRRHADDVLDLRERYQYILVDEYQDTSGAQNELLDLLCGDPADQPNVFVVGDDDQSIYRFQGANMDNIVDYTSRYHHGLTYVVLTDNYRCSPRILSGASQLIQHNKQRLINHIEGLSKDLRAAGENANYSSGLRVAEYADEMEEHLAITHRVQELIDTGVPPHEIAVLYTKHSLAEPLVRYWNQVGIPYSMRRPENLFDQRIVRMMIDLLTALHAGIDDRRAIDYDWYRIMLQPWFGIGLEDAAHLSSAYYRARKAQHAEMPHSWLAYYRHALAEVTESYRTGVAIQRWIDLMEKWTRQADQMPLMDLIDHLLYESPIGLYIHGSDTAYDDISRVYSFFDFIKQRCMRDITFDLTQLLDRLDRMRRHEVKLPHQRLGAPVKGVQLTTYHSAKGLEYDYVIMMGTTKDRWTKSRKGSQHFKLPPTSAFVRPGDDPEEKRRLYYVGVTRAKEEAFVTSSATAGGAKALERSVFTEQLIEEQVVDHYPYTAMQADRMNYMAAQMHPRPAIKDMPIDLVQDVISRMSFSITAIDKYMQCPVTFYYENILRAPHAPSHHLGFGNAVHEALERYFIPKVSGDALPVLEDLISYFDHAMKRHRVYFTSATYEDHMSLGHQLLTTYHEKMHTQWAQIPRVDTELRMRGVGPDGTPLVGVFDRVDHYADHIQILDYKTGKAGSARDKLAPPKPREAWDDLRQAITTEVDPEKRAKLKKQLYGGSYWRQLVFYRILAQHDTTLTKPLTQLTMSFLDAGGDDKMYARVIDVTPEAVAMLHDHMKQVIADIQALKFDEGCGRKHCPWCRMLSDRMTASS